MADHLAPQPTPLVTVAAATDSLPQDLRELAAEAEAAGINNVTRLIDRWADGTERYDRPGESVLVAWASARVVGVGGLSQCRDVPAALRVRRFFVSADVRRRGIARRLAEQLIASGFEHTSELTCNAGASAAAPPFWEALGFQPVDVAGITHRLERSPAD